MIRTLEQNRLYWAIIGEAARSMHVTRERLHEYLKAHLLCDPQTLEVGSTADLDKENFSKFLDQAQGLIEQKTKGVQTMYEQTQQGGYQPQYQQPQQPQPQQENLFCGSGKIRQTNFGPVLRISFTAQDLDMMRAHLSQAGWVNLDCMQRRELGRNGQTHYLKIDTWQPNGGMQSPQYQPQPMPQYQNPPQVAYTQQRPQPMRQPAPQYDDGGYNSYQPRPRATTPPVRSNQPAQYQPQQAPQYQPQVQQQSQSAPSAPPEPQYDDLFDPQELDQPTQTQHTVPREDIPTMPR